MRGYDDWKLETPEDEEYRRRRFLSKLYRRRNREYDPDEERERRQDVLDDYYEECKADCDRTGRR